MIRPNFNTSEPEEIACPACGAIDIPRLGPGSGPHSARADCAHCGAFLRWLPKPRTPEEREKKDAQAELHRAAWMREQSPTARQIQHLQRLGYHGPCPAERLEASSFIDSLLKKGGCR